MGTSVFLCQDLREGFIELDLVEIDGSNSCLEGEGREENRFLDPLLLDQHFGKRAVATRLLDSLLEALLIDQVEPGDHLADPAIESRLRSGHCSPSPAAGISA